jgi:[acyl-carrier-protein] S-malonyltransferase
MKAYVFPGQGAQFEGMGKELYEASPLARSVFDEANDVLGYDIKRVMFAGSAEELKQTKITQPAIFIHSIASLSTGESSISTPYCVAGHSLGEFSALVGAGVLKFADALKLVRVRAEAMQKACEAVPSTMAAIVGLTDEQVEDICEQIDGIVVPANYNCPGQLVISGEINAVQKAVDACKGAGAKLAVTLQVSGAFHSPLMEPARQELSEAIHATNFNNGICPIYQNVSGLAVTETDLIRENLIAQLTAPVRWTQTMENMVSDGVEAFVEVGGNGKVLSGFVKRLDRNIPTERL